jgi:hypothetical protein
MTLVFNGHQGISPLRALVARSGRNDAKKGRTPLSAGQTRKTKRTPPLRAVKKANGLAGGAEKRPRHLYVLFLSKKLSTFASRIYVRNVQSLNNKKNKVKLRQCLQFSN